MPLTLFFIFLIFWAVVESVDKALHRVSRLAAAVRAVLGSAVRSLPAAARSADGRIHHAATR